MKLIARQKIIGAESDLDLVDLKGIRLFEAETESFKKMVELYVEKNHGIYAVTYEPVE